MADWNPNLYKQFEDERTRPARDLLARTTIDRPREIVDLGCGPGNSTELLVERYPDARVIGIDSSAAMLVSARARLPGVTFIDAAIESWSAERPLDLLFANAVLQWLPDHATLLPRLFAMLAPGGVLALQMPDNFAEPSHRLMREVAAEGPWSHRFELAGAARAPNVLPAEAYYDLLAPVASATDVWRTVYRHPMASPTSIVDWLSSTGLRPFIDRLPEEERPAYLARYEAAIGEAYPARADGLRLLAFPRLFIMARRKG